jgi:hypothetical protein
MVWGAHSHAVRKPLLPCIVQCTHHHTHPDSTSPPAIICYGGLASPLHSPINSTMLHNTTTTTRTLTASCHWLRESPSLTKIGQSTYRSAQLKISDLRPRCKSSALQHQHQTCHTLPQVARCCKTNADTPPTTTNTHIAAHPTTTNTHIAALLRNCGRGFVQHLLLATKHVRPQNHRIQNQLGVLSFGIA